jgi:hypothetical protein
MLLLKAMIVRRVPKTSRIESQLLMEALQADHERVRVETPHLYFSHWDEYLAREVDYCRDQELIDDGVRTVKGKRRGPNTHGYTRTSLGDIFLRTLEPKLAQALEDMPMSDVGVLDFLSLF